MNTYRFNATESIVQVFTRHNLKYQVVNAHGLEVVLAGFPVDNGPNVIMQFVSHNDTNAVSARIHGIITNTPKGKHPRILEACNYLNRKIRYLKFYLDSDGDISADYDFPAESSDENIGEMAFEIFLRSMKILDLEYAIFTKALYTDEELIAG